MSAHPWTQRAFEIQQDDKRAARGEAASVTDMLAAKMDDAADGMDFYMRYLFTRGRRRVTKPGRPRV